MDLIEKLKDPLTYGENVKRVNLLQTHISFVALTGEYAYKIKKPVNFGFLDFSTIEKRRFFCEEELRLNRRLCPDIYLEVLPVTKKGNKISIGGDGEIIDYALKMREFSQDRIMTNMLKENKVDEDTIDRIVDILVKFYKSSERSKDIDFYGSVGVIKTNTDENFSQTEPFVDKTIEEHVYKHIKDATNEFLEKKRDVFENRIKNRFICDCHGDLHSGNIVIEDKSICIFDCIEFNERFRYSDVASDVAFLAMDLDFLGYPYLSAYFIEKYVDMSGDYSIFDVLNFYKCYRAYVRGKVNSFKLEDKNISAEEKKEIRDIAKKYFDLAFYYSKLFSIELKKDRPLLFATTGLVGTGKTTVAKKISIDYNARIISTDVVRKELEGIDKFERRFDDYNKGLYSPEKMAHTYERVVELASDELLKNKNIVLDGTFKNKLLREKVKDLSNKTRSRYLFLYCNCPEEKVKEYLESRIKKRSISDGRWEIYVKQKKDFERPDKSERFIEIDISNKSFDYQIDTFNKILNSIMGD